MGYNSERIKEQGAVMEKAFDIVSLPGAFRLSGRIEISLMGVVCREAYIVDAFMISQRGSPHTFAVDILLPLQPPGRRTVQLIVHIGKMLPVAQVVGTKD